MSAKVPKEGDTNFSLFSPLAVSMCYDILKTLLHKSNGKQRRRPPSKPLLGLGQRRQYKWEERSLTPYILCQARDSLMSSSTSLKERRRPTHKKVVFLNSKENPSSSKLCFLWNKPIKDVFYYSIVLCICIQKDLYSLLWLILSQNFFFLLLLNMTSFAE